MKAYQYFSQMNEDVGPVILINKFDVNPSESDEFVKAWAEEAEKFKGQSWGSSPHNYIEVLVGAEYSLTMQFGSRQLSSRTRLTKL